MGRESEVMYFPMRKRFAVLFYSEKSIDRSIESGFGTEIVMLEQDESLVLRHYSFLRR